MMKEEIVEKLREYRTKKGLTQEELAEILDISRSKVSSWETNKREMSITEAVKISKIYEFSLDNLFGDKNVSINQYLEISDNFIENKGISLGEKIKVIELVKNNLKEKNVDELYENYKMTQNATK